MYRIVLILLAALCARFVRRPPSSQQQTSAAPQMRVFLPAIAPSSLSDDAKRDYLRWHYWDRFDFADTLLFARSIRCRWSRPMSAGLRLSPTVRPTARRWIRSCAALRLRVPCSTTSRCWPSRLSTTPIRRCATTNSIFPFFGPCWRVPITTSTSVSAPPTISIWRCRTASASAPTISAIRSLRAPLGRSTA